MKGTWPMSRYLLLNFVTPLYLRELQLLVYMELSVERTNKPYGVVMWCSELSL